VSAHFDISPAVNLGTHVSMHVSTVWSVGAGLGGMLGGLQWCVSNLTFHLQLI
jgi:hypothetical protein